MIALYRHTQWAKLILCLVGIPILVIIAVLVWVEFNIPALLVLVFLVICLIIFSALTVEVTHANIGLHFGPGLVRKGFPASEVRRVSAVRNSTLYGWGIRRLPKGWLYNVSGLDAVELEMSDGQVHRIGTDQPEELLAAIKSVVK